MTNAEIQQKYDYRFETQFPESRIEALLESQWEDFGHDGFTLRRSYVIWMSFEY